MSVRLLTAPQQHPAQQLRALPPVWIDALPMPLDELDREARLADYSAVLLRHVGDGGRLSPTTLAECRAASAAHADLAVAKRRARLQQRRQQETRTMQWADDLTRPVNEPPPWSAPHLLRFTAFVVVIGAVGALAARLFGLG